MKTLFLHQHLGLGDQLMCNAMTRYYASVYDVVYLYAKSHNLETVAFMFRDLDNVKYLKFDPTLMNEYAFVNQFKTFNIDSDHLDIGFSNLDLSKNIHLDEQFYAQANLSVSKRFTDFYVQRDAEREMKIFNSLNIKENEYILICNESSWGKSDIRYNDYTKHPNAKVVYVKHLSDNMFDWLYVAEHALEIYAIESSFRIMIDSCFKLDQPLFVKLKISNTAEIPSTQNNWTLID